MSQRQNNDFMDFMFVFRVFTRFVPLGLALGETPQNLVPFMFGNLSSRENRTKIILNSYFTIDLLLCTLFLQKLIFETEKKQKKNQIAKIQLARFTSFSFLCITGYVYTSYYCTNLQI